MARNIEAAGTLQPTTERRVISFSSFQERPNGRSRQPTDASAPATEPRRMILLAEQAHQADEIEQAKSLIEKVYAIYDQCIPVADGVATHEHGARAIHRPRNLTSDHP